MYKDGGYNQDILIVGLAVLLFLFISLPSSFAATLTSDGTATVTVSPIFELSIDTNSIPFGSVKPGEFKELTKGPQSGTNNYWNQATCKANTGNKWYLKIQATGPLISGSNQMNVSVCKWLSTYAGIWVDADSASYDLSDGLNHSPTGGYVDFTQSPELVYTSGLDPDYNDTVSEGTQVQFQYAIQPPSDQLPGNYTSTIRFTLTE
jgi:hypothetical protein